MKPAAWLAVILSLAVLPCKAASANAPDEDESIVRSGVIQDILTRLSAAEKRIQEQDVIIKQLQTKLKSKTKAHDKSKDYKFSNFTKLMSRKPPVMVKQKTKVRPERQLNLDSAILQHMNTGAASNPVASPSGSVYTRWSRTVCGGDSYLIYEGFAAGADFSAKTGGTNYQCLPLDPEYNKYTSGGAFSSIKGVEMESQRSSPFPSDAHEQNIPCARCYSPRSAQMMIPAKRTCPEGWTWEYEGYLMTGNNGHGSQYSSTTYECVDSKPEYIRGMYADTDGALFYFVKPDCDGAGTTGHCPPYVKDRQLTCVVCTK